MYKKFYTLVSLVSGLIILLFVLITVFQEGLPEWKHYQKTYKKLFMKNALDDASMTRARSIDIKIRQIYLAGLKKDDRCMSCHAGVKNPLMTKAKPPFKFHSGNYLQDHPVEKYGCTICHYGQGRGLSAEQAHGNEAHWLKPRLKGIYAQAQCGKCHFMDQRLPLEAALPGGEGYKKGWALYMDNNCLGCHQFKNRLYGRPDRIGPILTPVGQKVNSAWLKQWIKNPKDYLPNTKMPNFLLEDPEVELIAPYLLSLAKGKKIREPKARKKLRNRSAQKNGKKRVQDLGCLGCHSIEKEGGDFAPDLSSISTKTHPQWLFFWLKDPKIYQPETKMPNLRLAQKELQEIVAYLNTLKPDVKSSKAASVKLPSPAKKTVESGRALVNDKGCTGCHKIEAFALGYNAPEHDGIGSKWPHELVWGNTKGVDRTLLNWLKIKITEPRRFASDTITTRMPVFGVTSEDAEALVTFLLGLTKETIPQQFVKVLADPADAGLQGQRFLEDHNCLGCHKIEKQGGDIGPDLSYEGDRVNPLWMARFLQTPYKIRPEEILSTRMPTFGMDPRQASIVTTYFARRNKLGNPYYSNPDKPVAKQNRDKAWRLYRQAFACHACHGWQGRGGMVGPDQSDLANRLRKQWTADWLKNPQKYIPDARMPNFELYDDEAVLLTDLLMSFKDVPDGVWDQMRRRWHDELLEQEAAQSAPVSTEGQGED